MRAAVSAVAIVSVCGSAIGQVLIEQPQPVPPPASAERGQIPIATDGAPSLTEVSLFAVAPPEPREFQENDLITIIISERSKTDRKQDFKSSKDSTTGGEVANDVDWMGLLEFQVQPGSDSNGRSASFGVDVGNEFDGKAQFKRDDTVTARVTARVIEVKPNGTLLVEARTTVKTDRDEEVITLSGICRTEDVTDANTVMSNQMFDMMLNIQHPGDVKNGSEKGVITRVMDVLFNW